VLVVCPSWVKIIAIVWETGKEEVMSSLPYPANYRFNHTDRDRGGLKKVVA
jgi:hypothetical protein